jgi:hypothetical protein
VKSGLRTRLAVAALSVSVLVGCPASPPNLPNVSAVVPPTFVAPAGAPPTPTAPPTDPGAVAPGGAFNKVTNVTGTATLAGKPFANATLRVEDAYANTAVAAVAPGGIEPTSGLFVDAMTLKTDAQGNFTVKVGNLSTRDVLRVVATSNGQVLTALFTGVGNTARQYHVTQANTSGQKNLLGANGVSKLKNDTGKRCTPGKVDLGQVFGTSSSLINSNVIIDDDAPIQNITSDSDELGIKIRHFIFSFECPRVIAVTATPTPMATPTPTIAPETKIKVDATSTALELIAREVLRLATTLKKDAAKAAIGDLVDNLNAASPEMEAAFAADPAAAIKLASTTSNDTSGSQGSPVLTSVLARNKLVQNVIDKTVSVGVKSIVIFATNPADVADADRLKDTTFTGAHITVVVKDNVVTVTNNLTGESTTVSLNQGATTVTKDTTTVTFAGGGNGNGTTVADTQSLSGQVVIDSNPAAGVQVALYLNGVLLAQTSSDAAGNFTFSSLAKGTYTLVFAADGARSMTRVVTI